MPRHPCGGCKAYDEPHRQQGLMNCPVLGVQIRMEQCNNVCGALPRQALIQLQNFREVYKSKKGGRL